MSWGSTIDSRSRNEAETEAAPETAIAAAFRRLDLRLKQGFATLEPCEPDDRASLSFRGLYLSPSDVLSYLDLEPGASRLVTAIDGEPAENPVSLLGTFEASTRFARFGRVFGLSPFDMAVVLIALGPEYDLKYERIYAFLQDDVSRRRPSVDLALNLLCTNPQEKLSRRAHFAPGHLWYSRACSGSRPSNNRTHRFSPGRSDSTSRLCDSCCTSGVSTHGSRSSAGC